MTDISRGEARTIRKIVCLKYSDANAYCHVVTHTSFRPVGLNIICVLFSQE